MSVQRSLNREYQTSMFDVLFFILMGGSIIQGTHVLLTYGSIDSNVTTGALTDTSRFSRIALL